jgi:predicted GH43/DUF377 family glycosyl hydrolase
MSLARYAREATRRRAPQPDVAAISGLIRWYSADTLTLADNSPVSTWADRSGNGADLTAAGAARPTLIQSRLDGKPGVVFSGAQKLASTAAGQPATDLTVFAVVANYKRGSSPQFVSWGNGSTFGFNLFGSSATDANGQPPALILKRSGTWGNNEAISSVIPGRGDPVILTGVASGTTTKIRIDKGNEVTDSGDSGVLDYGSGTIELALGDKGSAIAPMQGAIFEVLIFNRALTSDEIATVEAYLDEKWRVTIDKAAFVGLYNGESAVGQDYRIGIAWSADGKRWRRHLSNPVFTNSGSGWERDLVKDPWVIYDGTQYVLYYSGWTSATSKFQIGRATSSDLLTWTRDTSNPVIALGAGGAIDDAGCSFPTVIYDLEEADPSRRWKMWYTATKAGGNPTVAYAYSADGITWTKYGRVLDVGSAGTWDAIAVSPGCIYKDGATWYLFYQGRKNNTANPRWQGGVATFTDPESTYTKYASNPTIKARFNDSGTSQALTANLAAGGRTVTVADTSAFHVHEPVALDKFTSSSSVPEPNRILSIDSSTQLTLEWPVVNAFPTSDSSRIVSFAYNSLIPRSIRKLADGSFELIVVPFQPTDDGAHSNADLILREASAPATISSLTANAVLDDAAGNDMMLSDTGRWDELSAENFTTVLNFVPARYTLPPFIASQTVVYGPVLELAEVDVPFIASATVAHAPTLTATVGVPFISSATVVYTLTLERAEVDVPFIASTTRLYGIFSLFDDRTGFGPGNGGEGFRLKLAPNGTTETAMLAGSITDTDSLLALTGDGGLPASGAYLLTIDDEVLYVTPIGSGSYRIRRRALSNTLAAAHTAGADAVWTDTYDMAIESAANADATFTADIASSGSIVYPGWVMSFDSTQAYIGTARYPMHVTELVGVFDAGAGSGGTNRLDASQPNAISTPTGVSDDCPAALSVPALITTDIAAGDVALVRYTNAEATILELGARSVALQTWYGLKRVSATDVDVTFTDPTGNVVDGSVNDEWFEPVDRFTTTTLPGTDRTFTYGPPRYSERGWPIAALAVRQGTRRVPYWYSPTWHDFDFVYSGFDTDATFVQVLVNRNGVLFASDPEVELPGPQDIDGPDATWDDNTYYFGVSWLVAIFNGSYFVAGPALGGGGAVGPPPPTETAPIPSVTFGGGGSTVTIPPDVEDGAGGNIGPSGRSRFLASVV